MKNQFYILRILLEIIFLSSTESSLILTPQIKDILSLVHQNISTSWILQITNHSSIIEESTLYFIIKNEGIIKEPIENVTLSKSTQNLFFNVTFEITKQAGSTVIQANSTNDEINVSSAFVRIKVVRYLELSTLSSIIGWCYFISWSISFYPQIYENWKRRSVVGLNFDFLGLNILGFALYGTFNIALYWGKSIQEEYFLGDPTGSLPVQINDVIFSLHALFACLITLTQCLLYEKGSQTLSKGFYIIFCAIGFIFFICLFLAIFQYFSWLLFFNICSSVKLFITLIKYCPQAWMNYRRKSTVGWSIGNVLLDFSGGTLSMAQMFLDAYNNDDWESLFGNHTKFGLGMFSVLFDILFILQHYVFYYDRSDSPDVVASIPLPDEEAFVDINNQ